jgi:starch-binding outer membrane protein SusE/F
MKNKIFYLFLFFATTLALWSCEKEENRIFFEGGTAPVLTASRTGSIPLSFANKDQEAIRLSWTNPDYKFTTGISSQNVNYQLELDSAGKNFSSSKKKVVTLSNELGMTLTQQQLNDYLLNQLEFKTGVAQEVEIRVKSSLVNNAGSLESNVLKYTVTPYAIPPKVAPPASGKLFIVGSATPGAWNNPVPVPSQEFTKLSETQYQITIPITGGGSYLFLPVNGSWDAKFGLLGANNSNTNTTMEDEFKAGGGDILAPAASGTYKIEVNFQTGKFKLTKL